MFYLLSDNNILSAKNKVLGLWFLTLFQLYRGCLFYPLLLRMCCLFFVDLRILTSPWHFQTILLVEETGVPGEKHRPATSH